MSAHIVDRVFKRRVPKDDSLDEIRVVGGGANIVITSNTEFGPRILTDLKSLRQEYVTPDGADLEIPEAASPTGKMSPMEVFAAQSARAAQTTEPVPTTGRGRKRAQPSD